MTHIRTKDHDQSTEIDSGSIQNRAPLRRTVTKPMMIGSVLVAGGLIAAACGGASSASAPAKKMAPSHARQQAPAPSAPVKTASGPLGTYLVNASGLTLYRFTADTSGMSNCTGECAMAWPPLTTMSGASAISLSGAGGTFGSISRSDGALQLTYNGSPLYTFAGDKTPGQTNGQGLMGKWFVETVMKASSPAPSPSQNSSSSGGGSGY